MKKIILAIAMLLTIGAQAQNQKHQINGNNIVAVSQTKAKKEAQKTSYTYTIKGKTYEVHMGAKGSYITDITYLRIFRQCSRIKTNNCIKTLICKACIYVSLAN